MPSTDETRQTPAATVSHVCKSCGAAEPSAGWHTVGCSDGDAEFFCSAQCFVDDCDYLRDEQLTAYQRPEGER